MPWPLTSSRRCVSSRSTTSVSCSRLSGSKTMISSTRLRNSGRKALRSSSSRRFSMFSWPSSSPSAAKPSRCLLITLSREQLTEVVDLLLTHLRELVKGQGMTLEVSEAAEEYVVEQGYDAEYGARPLKRAIQRLVQNPLSGALLRGEFEEGDTVKVDLVDGSLAFTR